MCLCLRAAICNREGMKSSSKLRHSTFKASDLKSLNPAHLLTLTLTYAPHVSRFSNKSSKEHGHVQIFPLQAGGEKYLTDVEIPDSPDRYRLSP